MTTALMNILPPELLQTGLRGLEKENLRIHQSGMLSKLSHEMALKVSANHPNYSLDFAEAQLEVITRPHASLPELFFELNTRYQHVYTSSKPELLWPNSMPPQLTEAEIQIADFGSSRLAKNKALYRKGLIHRYGKMMQTICGIHFNYSLPEVFIKAYQAALAPKLTLIEVQNQLYFKMIHYFLEHYWLLIYLFGASPFAYQGSIKANTKAAEVLTCLGNDLYVAPFATSLRQSDLGYHNPKNCELMVCFQTLDTYIKTLTRATKTPFAAYTDIPKDQQLNTNYLQIENEFYAPIRPKQLLQGEERPLEALKARGVAYLEVRILDINPLLAFGVSEEQLAFIELFLLQGLFAEPMLSKCERDYGRSADNALKTSLIGRKPDLLLQKREGSIALREWASEILSALDPLVAFLGQAHYSTALSRVKTLLKHDDLLPSAQLVAHQDDYFSFMLALAAAQQQFFIQAK